MGNKYKLLSYIREVVDKECPETELFFDVFAGTGAVASEFSDKKVITNELLYSNYLAHVAFFGAEKYDARKVRLLIDAYNAYDVSGEPDNYMSVNFADTYFSSAVCKKIGFIREDIERLYRAKEINFRERAMLVTSLFYALDKIAKTVGHYDAYRKTAEFSGNLQLKMLKTIEFKKGIVCYNEDANLLVKRVKADAAYLDPPYNSRQYSDAYHLLENIAKWEKPKVFGTAKKMERKDQKSDYCTNKATQAFADLIENIAAKYIILSYNNTGSKADGRSNARIADEDIMRILLKKGRVKVFSTGYKAFTTGKSKNEENEERLFLCTCGALASPLNYTGGKYKLIKQIRPLFPAQIDTFVDLFAGGFNVGINIEAGLTIYNDSNAKLIGLFKLLKEMPEDETIRRIEEIIKEYGLSDVSRFGYEYYGCNSSNGLASYNKDKYLRLRADFNLQKEKDERYYLLLFVLIMFGFNNQIRFNRNGKFNLPVGKRDFNVNLRKKLRRFSARLKEQKALLLNEDYRKLDISGLTGNSLIYADPPYLITLAGYNEQGGWNEKKEAELLEYLDHIDQKGLRFALSNVLRHKGKENRLLLDWTQKNAGRYFVHLLDYGYSNANYQTKDEVGDTKEVLITNYATGRLSLSDGALLKRA